MNAMMFVKKAVVISVSLVLIFGVLALIRHQGNRIATQSAARDGGVKEVVIN